MKKEDLDKMSLQEACDYAVLKIVEQGRRCLENGLGMCRYSNDSGEHCAVGWLLDHEDEELMSAMCGVEDLINHSQNKAPELIQDNVKVFELLRWFHDTITKANRQRNLDDLSKHIDTTPPQYHQWVDMGK